MSLLTSTLYQKEPGTKFKVVDPILLDKIPSLKGLELTLSVIKRSGPRTFIQYVTPNGAGTLKLMADYDIEITEESEIITLSSFITKFRFSDRKPSRIAIKNPQSLTPSWYNILPGFWEQNPKNIRLKKIQSGYSEMKVPGAWVVEGMDIPMEGLFKKIED